MDGVTSVYISKAMLSLMPDMKTEGVTIGEVASKPVSYTHLETKFPGNTYAHHLCFVGKKGLYISENNENNPQFDENKLVFRCFTLQGRKK